MHHKRVIRLRTIYVAGHYTPSLADAAQEALMAEDENLKLTRQLCFAVYAAGHAFNRIYKPILEPLGLTYPQYLVMLVLWEQDGLTVKEIGQQLHLDSGTLTPVLKRLQAMGYVQRSRDLPDERQVRVTLTERGRAIREQAVAGRTEVVCASGLSEQQIQVLKRELDQLSDALRGQAERAEDEGPREPSQRSGSVLKAPHRRSNIG